MLKTPALVDPLWYHPLTKACQIWGMKHTNLYPVLTKLLDEWYEKRRAAWFGCLAGSTQGVCQDGNFELWISFKCISDCQYLWNCETLS